MYVLLVYTCNHAILDDTPPPQYLLITSQLAYQNVLSVCDLSETKYVHAIIMHAYVTPACQMFVRISSGRSG